MPGVEHRRRAGRRGLAASAWATNLAQVGAAVFFCLVGVAWRFADTDWAVTGA